jgi:hypothetical protein
MTANDECVTDQKINWNIVSMERYIYTPYVDVATYKWKLEIISFVAFFVIKVQLINKFSSFVEFVEYYYFLTKRPEHSRGQLRFYWTSFCSNFII